MFAQHIVDSKVRTIEISVDILDVTKVSEKSVSNTAKWLTSHQDAISGREQAAKWYTALGEDTLGDNGLSLDAANDSHQYFLKALRQIFDILRKEHKSRCPKRKKRMPVLASDTNDLTNLYVRIKMRGIEHA